MPATLTEAGDVMIEAAAQYKCRTEKITIDNTDTDHKTITIQESLRLVHEDGSMGKGPIVQMAHGYAISEPAIAQFVWNGLTLLDVFSWIQAWATTQNLKDAQTLVDMIVPPGQAPVADPLAPDGGG